MKKSFIRFAAAAGVSALFAAFSMAPRIVAAQTPPYVDSHCGSWVNDVWMPNGNCSPDDTHRRHAEITGQITSVNGNMVTISQSNGSTQINDQPALSRQQTGRVAVGRQVVAYGYWWGGTFYATAIY